MFAQNNVNAMHGIISSVTNPATFLIVIYLPVIIPMFNVLNYIHSVSVVLINKINLLCFKIFFSLNVPVNFKTLVKQSTPRLSVLDIHTMCCRHV